MGIISATATAEPAVAVLAFGDPKATRPASAKASAGKLRLGPECVGRGALATKQPRSELRGLFFFEFGEVNIHRSARIPDREIARRRLREADAAALPREYHVERALGRHAGE